MIRIKGKCHYDLFCEGRKYGAITIEPFVNPNQHSEEEPGALKIGNIHCHIIRFTPSIFNRAIRDESSLMNYIRPSYDKLVTFSDRSVIHNADPLLWEKFLSIFDFSPPLLYSERMV